MMLTTLEKALAKLDAYRDIAKKLKDHNDRSAKPCCQTALKMVTAEIMQTENLLKGVNIS
jgi:hypothetical protein